MKDSRSLLICSAIAFTSPMRTASHSRSIRGSTMATRVFMSKLLWAGSILLQVSVSRQPLLVTAQEHAGLLQGDPFRAQGRLGRPPHPGHQIVPVVAHVAEHVAHRVATHHPLDGVVLV